MVLMVGWGKPTGYTDALGSEQLRRWAMSSQPAPASTEAIRTPNLTIAKGVLDCSGLLTRRPTTASEHD